ncbi:24070_t:CDS:2, partial [Gigaspora margarita]
NSLLTKQAVSLLKRLNGTGQVEQITKIRIRQGILRECITQDIWQHQDIKLDERVWHSNVAVNTIEQCKNLNLIFDMLEGSWHLQENGPTIISMLDSKVPLWFQKLEELLINYAKSRKVKENLFINDINTFALQLHCENVILNNRCKQWIWFIQKNTKKWHLGRVTKLLEKSSLIKYWTEMHIQGGKCILSKCGNCNLNTKGKKNRCIINSNKNLIRGAVVGITKKENNWITNFPTTLLKDKPEYHLTPVQE